MAFEKKFRFVSFIDINDQSVSNLQPTASLLIESLSAECSLACSQSSWQRLEMWKPNIRFCINWTTQSCVVKVLLIEGKLPSFDFSSICLNSSSGDLLLTKIFFEFGVPSAAFGLAGRFDAYDGTNEFCKSEVPERSIELTYACLILLLVPSISVTRGECWIATFLERGPDLD